ncbi:MAG: cytochrome B [Pseudomonadales bacterium]|nr:cytochrome B [Pseudomonadales bacterium]NIX08746.1 cytochrome B [Pseudomonadales bacterium]
MAAATVVWELPMRVWHWALAACVTGSLYTGLAGDITLMECHQQFGYGVLGLLLFRLGWGLWGGRYARFGNYRLEPRRVVAHFRGRDHGAPHTAPGMAFTVFILLALAVQVVTGLFATDDIFTEGPLSGRVEDDTARALTGVHHRVYWLILAGLAAHLTAHAVYALRRDPMPLAMITGRKRLAMEPARPASMAALLTAAAAAALVWLLLELA